MKYDVEIILPVCGRFSSRIEDFKKYGLLNTSGRRVLVNVLISDEELDGLEVGWPEDVEVRLKRYECQDHVSNIYRFYSELDSGRMEAKWLMRVDDDSCTDIGGLLSNLDAFYDWEGLFYLGDMTTFGRVLEASEGNVYKDYKYLLGDLERVVPYLNNEIECGIVSKGAMERILGESKSVRLLKHRAKLRGGYGDCVTALAAIMAKVYPMQCPFISHLPRIVEFSLFGGHLNHIHAISRNSEGENFHESLRSSKAQYEALIRQAEGVRTELEREISGKRFLLETDNELTLYEFMSDKTAKIKFDGQKYIWLDFEGSIVMFSYHHDSHREFRPDGKGNMVGLDHEGNDLILKPV